MKHLVIGHLGSIGSRHFRLLKEAGEEVRGIEKEDNYTGTADLFNNNNLKDMSWADMFWICIPNILSEKRKYIAWGAKNKKKIFVEKPNIDTDIKGKIFTACNYRFHPAVKVLKENLHKVGDILYSRIHYSHYLPYQRENWKEYIKDTNIILDCGWHFVDLALWLFGKVYAWNTIDNSLELDCNDTAQFWLNHKNSFTYIWCDYLRRDKSWGVEVVGKKGTLILQVCGKGDEYSTIEFRPNGISNGIKLHEMLDCTNNDTMYKNQLNYLLKENWKSNIDEAIEVTKICG